MAVHPASVMPTAKRGCNEVRAQRGNARARQTQGPGNTSASAVLSGPVALLGMVLLLVTMPGASALVKVRAGPVLALAGHGAPLRVRGGGAQEGDPSRIVMGDRTWLSKMTFSYVNSLLEAGFDHPLEADELPTLPAQDMAELHVKNLEEAWLERKTQAVMLARQKDEAALQDRQQAGETQAAVPLSAEEEDKKSKAIHEKTLLGAVWSTFGTAFLMGGIWKVPQDILSFASPFLVKAMYKYVDPKEAVDPSQQTWAKGLGICFMFFLVQYVASVALHQYFDEVFKVSLQIRAGLVACVYRKALRLSHASRSHKSLGELVNLMSVDVQRMTDLVPYLHNLAWSSPLQIIIAMVLLYRLVGVASLVGLFVMIAVMPVNAVILLKLRKLQEANMKEKDKRVKQVSEMLQSIKVIKMFAWEKPLAVRISEDRKQEVARLKRYGYISSLQSIFWNSAPVTVSIATFGAYTAMGNKLDMHIVLPALAIINIMSFPLFVFPLLISAVISGRVAMGRLNDFINLPERDTSHITRTMPSDPVPIKLTDVTVGWNSSRPIVANLSVEIQKGSFTAIIGPVGAGKSTVLASILGDSMVLGGTISAPWGVGYVPQQPWIQNANVRANILFGKPFDPRRYAATIEACALEADFEKFPDGDLTEIGERGVNLSGGQKQRIALARAVYQNSETMLLDDVLSALDSHVGAHVLDHCLLDLLANTTRVLVTHKLDVLQSVDNVIVLGQQGKVLAQGTLDQVIAQGIDLQSVVAEAEAEASAAVSSNITLDATNRAAKDAEEYAKEAEKEAANDVKTERELSQTDLAKGSAQNVPKGKDVSKDSAKEAANKQPESPKKWKGAGDIRVVRMAKEIVKRRGSFVSSPAADAAAGHAVSAAEEEDAKEIRLEEDALKEEDQTQVQVEEQVVEKKMKTEGAPQRSTSFHQQVAPESRVQGAVSTEIYLTYLRELQYPMLALISVVGVLSQGARNGNDWWLTRWASAADRNRVAFYLGIYALTNVGSSLLFLLRDITMMLTELRAASALHNRMLDAVMKAPMSFFDSTPVGRVLNRFSNDQESLDSTLPRTLNQLFSCGMRVGGTLLMICFVNPAFMLALVPVAYLYWQAQQYYGKSSRELKRIESTTKSPLYSHFGESIAGSSIIRAAGEDARFRQENCERVNKLNNLFGLINDCNRWLAIRLELCGNGIVTGAALTGVISRKLGWVTPNRASLVGLSLTLALAVTNSLGWMVRMSTETEAQMNAVERVAEYASIEHEESWLRTALATARAEGGVTDEPQTSDTALGVADEGGWVEGSQENFEDGRLWPTKGDVVFRNYSMTYRGDLPDVISDISLTIKAGEKVGVCGRTGAGKSSLLMALYRMALVSSGSISIDGLDISKVPLQKLRSGLAIVPQEPMLFAGSIAYNLDPFGDFAKEQLWEALASVQLDEYIKSLPEGIESSVGEGGSALSVGQRQLLCMARALLRGTRLLVLDEATAAVDEVTDMMIQKAVRKSCKGCTVITIAHRLNTIMDYDKVMVLGAGKLLEYDSPQALLENPNSEFSQLVANTQVKRTRSRGKDLNLAAKESA